MRMSLAFTLLSGSVFASLSFCSASLAETISDKNSDIYSEVFPPLPVNSNSSVNKLPPFYWKWMEHYNEFDDYDVIWTDLVDVLVGGGYKINTNEDENWNGWVKLRLRPLSLYLPVPWLMRAEVGVWGQYIKGEYRNPGSEQLARSPWDKYFVGPDLKLVSKYVTIDENFGVGRQNSDTSSKSGQYINQQDDDLIYNQLLLEVRWPNRELGLFPRTRIMYEYQSDSDTDFTSSWNGAPIVGDKPTNRVRQIYGFDQDLYHFRLPPLLNSNLRITPFLTSRVERNDGENNHFGSWGGGVSIGKILGPTGQTDLAHLKVDFQDAGIDRWQSTIFIDVLKFW